MSALVTGRDLFWDFSKSEGENLSNDLMPSLEVHPGSNSSRDNCKSPGNYTLGAFGESLDKTKVNLIVKLDDVQSSISMTSSDSSKSYGIFYLRNCNANLDKILYELHMEDEEYFQIARIIAQLERILRHQSAKLHRSTTIWIFFWTFFTHTRSSPQEKPM